MNSIFSELPNNLIIQIVQIENRRKYEKERMKFGEVIQELNKLSTIDIYCPSIRDMIEGPPPSGERPAGGFGCWTTWAAEQELLFDTEPW